MKEQIQCPFAVHFKYLARIRDDKMEYIHYRVEVINYYGIHNWCISRETMHTAEKKISGEIKYDLKHMNILIGMLKSNPNLDAKLYSRY